MWQINMAPVFNKSDLLNKENVKMKDIVCLNDGHVSYNEWVLKNAKNRENTPLPPA